MKRQLMKWEKIFANHLSDKELIPKYIYNSYNSTVKKKKKIQLKKGQRSRTSFPKKIQKRGT